VGGSDPGGHGVRESQHTTGIQVLSDAGAAVNEHISLSTLTSDFQQARTFLERVLSWPKEGKPGYVNIHWTFQVAGHDKPRWGGRAVRTLNEALNAIAWAMAQPSTRDIYFCTSLQAQAKEKIGRNGYRSFMPIRNQAGALALKSLFLDVDVKGGDNGYASMNEAIKAVAKFVVDANLPKPNAHVHSGGGLHVYWVMNKPLTPAEWQPLANGLAELAKKHGLKCDTCCTVDSARILRVPQTWNCKGNDRRLVKLLGLADVEYDLDAVA
jgi:hypothetical protein